MTYELEITANFEVDEDDDLEHCFQLYTVASVPFVPTTDMRFDEMEVRRISWDTERQCFEVSTFRRFRDKVCAYEVRRLVDMGYIAFEESDQKRVAKLGIACDVGSSEEEEVPA